jgi:hypothetical protein
MKKQKINSSVIGDLQNNRGDTSRKHFQSHVASVLSLLPKDDIKIMRGWEECGGGD